MDKKTRFIIEGGKKLSGEVTISGSKHSAVSMIIGALLTDDPVEISNVPDILDVKYAIAYVSELGAKVSWPKKDRVRIKGPAFGLRLSHTAKKLRYSLLGLGVQLTRTGHANMFFPGGCNLGDRQCNFHIDGLQAMGAAIQDVNNIGIVGRARLRGGLIDLPYPSVSATLNLLCAASLAREFTIIRNAAVNPEVIDFIEFLKSMGAKIEQISERDLRITGVERLHGTEYRIMGDRIEAATFIIATAIAGGNVLLRNCRAYHLRAEIKKLSEIGVVIIAIGDGIRVKSASDYVSQDVTTRPYPGFHTDVQPLTTALLATVSGNSCVVERINNDRFRYVKELQKMGAEIRVVDEEWLCPNGKRGQSLYIDGADLRGAYVNAPDLRGGAALVLAALGAEGQTVINNVDQIDRGYEQLDKKLRHLGADIKRIDNET